MNIETPPILTIGLVCTSDLEYQLFLTFSPNFLTIGPK